MTEIDELLLTSTLREEFLERLSRFRCDVVEEGYLGKWDELDDTARFPYLHASELALSYLVPILEIAEPIIRKDEREKIHNCLLRCQLRQSL